ncbi:MAG: helix-turn-helix domain-containing protein [Aurantibacter sp.]
MKEAHFDPPEALRPYVNNIMVMESDDSDGMTNLPLYADGYPGIMFQQSENGFYFLPKGKELSELFLYGQTVHPAWLETKGPFKFIVFQLYPFASKYLLDVNPRELNDDCFDLLQLKHVDVVSLAEQLRSTTEYEARVEIVTELMLQLVEHYQVRQDDRIQKAISIILENKGQSTISEVRNQVFVTERTFERNFTTQVGLSPKQFAKIIQFKSSLQQLTEENYDQLLDVGLDSGFADQSHFIRSFKKYTGKTPSEFIRQASA